MTKHFPLAGLLRLRRLQEDQAAAEVAAAATRARASAAAAERALLLTSRSSLERAGRTGAGVVTGADLAAIARRDALRSAEATAAAAAAAADADAVTGAGQQWAQARARAEAVETLAVRHRRQRVAARRAAEQKAVDDLVAASWGNALPPVRRWGAS